LVIYVNSLVYLHDGDLTIKQRTRPSTGCHRELPSRGVNSHRRAFDIYSSFPSITGDLYGNKWATTNHGIVYTSKRVATAFAGPGAAWLFAKTGSWTKVFWVMIICDLIAAFMALLWLKPRAARMIAKSEGGLPLSTCPRRLRSWQRGLKWSDEWTSKRKQCTPAVVKPRRKYFYQANEKPIEG
jgi:hypothetical protein